MMKKLLLKAKSLILLAAIFCLFSPYAKGAIATFHTTYGAGSAQMPDDPSLIQKYNTWLGFVNGNGAGGYLRVHYTEGVGGQADGTASEGIGYGMLLAVYFNDQTTFNGLWNYKVLHSPNKGLMAWLVSSGGGNIDTNSASDADADIAMALLLAHRRWGSTGAFNYSSLATTEINKVASSDVDGTDFHIFPGDYCAHNTPVNTYPSYFTPAWYTEFGVQTGNVTFWANVATKAAGMLAAGCRNATGLATEQCSATGGAVGGSDGYNSARIPWRYSLDYSWNGTASSLSQINMDNVFFAGKATSVGAVYNITGGNPTDTTHNGMRIGPVGTSFMVTGKTADLTAFYTEASSNFNDPTHFYNETLALLSLLDMSGNMPKVFGAQQPTPTPPTGDLFDDCEDKDNVNEWGGYWYTYDDLGQTPIAGDSLIVPWTTARYGKALMTPTPFYMQAPGYPASTYGTLYAARMTGVVTITYAYGFIGMGSGTNSSSGDTVPQVTDLSMYTGMRFWVKTLNATDSYSVKIKCPTSVTNPAGNDYKYSFIGSTTWSQVAVPFINLTQENWGTSTVYVDKTLVEKNSTDVQWQTVSQPHPAVDIMVDDIEFYPAKTPTMVPTYCPGEMLDTLEDGDSQNNFGGYWYTYNNVTAPASTIWPSSAQGATFTPSAPGANGTFYCARITGTVSAATVAFVGMGTNMTADGVGVRDVHVFVGLNFWVKGDGNTYSVKIKAGPTVITGGNDYKFSFKTNAGTWEQMTIPFSIFTQEKNWGTVVPLVSTVLTSLQQIQFESKGISHLVDLSIDDLAFECSQGWTPTVTKTVPPPSSTITPTFTVTPTRTVTGTSTRSATPTSTNTAVQNTATFTITITNTPTYTRTATPTSTGISSFTSSPTSTNTVTLTFTGTRTESPTFTYTSTNPSTATFTGTRTSSPTYTNTATNTATSTFTGSATASSTYTGTLTGTPSRTQTASPSSTRTPTFTPTWTFTGTNTPTFTVSNTHTVSPTNTPYAGSPTDTPSVTETLTGTPSFTPTDSHTLTFTSTYTRTATYTSSSTVTFTKTATATLTFTLTPTPTDTLPGTASMTPTVTRTSSKTPSPSITVTSTTSLQSPTITQTFTSTDVVPSATFTSTNVPFTATYTSTDVPFTPTFTPTDTYTPTFTQTFTETFSQTFTQTYTYSNTNTPTYTVTDTPTTVPTVNAPSLDVIIEAPASATVGEQIYVTMTVKNNGNSLITGITPAALDITGTGVLTLVSNPIPGSVASLDINATTTFVWKYTVTTAGYVSIQGTANGNSGAVISPVKTGVGTTLELAPTLTYTRTPVVMITPTPTMGNVLVFVTATPVLIYPNPNPTPGTTPSRIIGYTVSRPISKAVFRLYTSMGRLIRQVEDTTAHVQGKALMNVDGSYFQGLSRGIYYYVIIATDKETNTQVKSPIEKAIIQ